MPVLAPEPRAQHQSVQTSAPVQPITSPGSMSMRSGKSVRKTRHADPTTPESRDRSPHVRDPDLWGDSEEPFLSEGECSSDEEESAVHDPSSKHDTSSFSSFLKDMCDSLSIPLEAESKKSKAFLDALDFDQPPKEYLKLPLHDILRETFYKNLETPLTVPGAPCKLDSLYKVIPIPGFDKPQLPHESLLVESTLKKSAGASVYASVPPGREGKAMDKFGKRLYQNAMLANRAGNYGFHFSFYLKHLLTTMAAFEKYLPQRKQQSFHHCLSSLFQLRKFMVRSIYDTFELTSRATAMSVAMRRLAWLRVSELDVNHQDRLANTPCLGDELFGESMDSTTQKLSAHETRWDTLLKNKKKPPPTRPFRQQSAYQRRFTARPLPTTAQQPRRQRQQQRQPPRQQQQQQPVKPTPQQKTQPF
uniref:Uncharacterized protein LOC117367413 n=1 Tax=Geotrypetes seraphini TaxID=260995 RepID=A0A6P8SCE3_GEOSA|nr:uncharacterized protein LOC117367413 [Geotrypetes seraphini]